MQLLWLDTLPCFVCCPCATVLLPLSVQVLSRLAVIDTGSQNNPQPFSQ